MCTKRQLRRTVSLGLALALMFWTAAVPAMNPSSTYVNACRGMHAAMHTTQLSSHHCCPHQLHTTSTLLEPSATAATSLCHLDCCTVRRRPSRSFAFLANNIRPSADTVRTSAEETVAPSATAFAVLAVHSPVCTKAVFDLKADLRI
jgi:hypothetical protein